MLPFGQKSLTIMLLAVSLMIVLIEFVSFVFRDQSMYTKDTCVHFS